MANARKEAKGFPNLFLAAREAIELLRKRSVVPPVFDVETPPLVKIFREIAADQSLPDGMFDKFLALKKASRISVGKLPPVKLDDGAIIIPEKPAFLRMGNAYTNLRAAVDEAHIDLNVIEKKIRQRGINIELEGEVAEQKTRDEKLKKLYK